MQTIAELQAQFPRMGRVTWIGLRPARRAPVVSVQEAEAHPLVGLIGDHGRTAPGRLTALSGEVPDLETLVPTPPRPPRGQRQVTLIQAEHFPVMAALLGLDELPPEWLRRNIAVAGINLLALKAGRLRVGGALLEGTGACHPCSRMEEALGPGGYNVVRGHGGLTARVIEGGIIRVGDRVEAL